MGKERGGVENDRRRGEERRGGERGRGKGFGFRWRHGHYLAAAPPLHLIVINIITPTDMDKQQGLTRDEWNLPACSRLQAEAGAHGGANAACLWVNSGVTQHEALATG